jgi:ribosomal protein S13
MTNDVLHQIALTQITGIGAVQAKQLVDHFGDAGFIPLKQSTDSYKNFLKLITFY